MCFRLGFVFQILALGVCENRASVFFRFGLIVSEPDLFAESLFGYTVFSKGLLGVVSSFSTALRVPSGFSDRRFETVPDLSFPRHEK